MALTTRSNNQAAKSNIQKAKSKNLTKAAKKVRFSKLKSKKTASASTKKTMMSKKSAAGSARNIIEKKSKSGPSRREGKAETEEIKFNIDVFIKNKLGALNTKNKILFDYRRSSLADLIKFNANMAHSLYKIEDMDTLEVSLLALQPQVDVENLERSPNVVKACDEVAVYKDLLLLGDLPTITQGKKPVEWINSAPSLSMPAQVALMTSFLTLAIKMTGKRPAKLNIKMPGGKISGKTKEEVISYLTIMQSIMDSMRNGNNWEKDNKFSKLKKMEKNFNKIIKEF